MQAGHGIRHARDGRLPKVEEDRVVSIITQTDANFFGVRCDCECIAELAAQVRGNADLPRVDLAVAVDHTERRIGGRDRDPVAARLYAFDRVIADRQDNAVPLAVGIEGYQRTLPRALTLNLIHPAGKQMGAVTAPGDFGEIAVVEALDVRVEAEL